jgi:methylenetetrahydrofolate dehydrogenase (NADP+)/methenyltetrahydrofolate cyclohydrolase
MIVDGKKIAAEMEKEIVERLADLAQKKLCFIIFGSDPASLQFVKRKTAVAERLGIRVKILQQPENISTEDAISVVQKAAEENCDGIVVQLPLPAGLDTEKILDSVPENLDIDLLGHNAKEKYTSGKSKKLPPVARAVKNILDFYNIDLVGKKIVIIGNGRLVGEPVATMLRLQKLPFIIIDKNTNEKERFAQVALADVIISGVGFPNLVKPEMIKDGVILIDAGTSEQNGKLVGDIDQACAEKASLLTPVPGGVGPVTVMSLFANL